jgi:hypothetical protein
MIQRRVALATLLALISAQPTVTNTQFKKNTLNHERGRERSSCLSQHLKFVVQHEVWWAIDRRIISS